MLGIIRRMEERRRQSEERQAKLKQIVLEHQTFCGSNSWHAEAWFRAEKEFGLADADAYECVKRLLAEVKELNTTIAGLTQQ